MSDIWSPIVALAFVTAVIKASGPIALGGRALPPVVLRVIALVAPSLLAALVVVETFAGSDQKLELDPRVLGVAGAAVVLGFRRDAMLTAVIVAAAVAAFARAVA
jgi:branched-subunit amino acid transport protein